MRYLGFIAILLFSSIISASEVTIPNTFIAGEKAIAKDVNDNFSEVADAINDNNDRINTNANGVKDNVDDLASKQNKITQECTTGTYLRKVNQDGTVVCEIDNVGTGNDGDITAVTAGTGLTGGAESGEAALSVDTSVIQQKLTNSLCPAGQYVASIAENGAVTCSTPPASTGDITAVNTAAGSGLTGGIDSGEANLAIDTNVVQAKLSGAACTDDNYVKSIAADGTTVCSAPPTSTGDITAVNTAAGSGLTGGIDSGEANLAIDTNVVQTKLSGADCTDDNYVKSIAADGTTVCSTPPASTGDITAVNTAAGSGLTGGIDSGEANLAIDTNVVQTKLSGAACTDDNYVKSIAADGTTVCSTPPASTGDITAVNTAAGSGLTGGIESGEANLVVDTTVIQKRVTGACAVGQVVTNINEDGTVTCGNAPTDIITENGLTQSVNDTTKAVTLSADQTYLQRRLNSACAEGSSLRDISEDGTPTCELDADTDTTYSAGVGINFTEATTINSTVGAAITIKPGFRALRTNDFSINEVAKVSMTTPENGHILVTHSGYIILFSTPNEVEVGIGATTSAMETSNRVGFLDTTGNDRYELAYSVTYLYSVESAGTYNYYGLAQKNEIFNAGPVNILPQSLTALFIPTKY